MKSEYINAERSESRALRQAWIESDDKRQRLERERNALRDAVRLAVAKHNKIAWGYDGDAGSNAIMSELEDSLDNANSADAPSKDL